MSFRTLSSLLGPYRKSVDRRQQQQQQQQQHAGIRGSNDSGVVPRRGGRRCRVPDIAMGGDRGGGGGRAAATRDVGGDGTVSKGSETSRRTQRGAGGKREKRVGYCVYCTRDLADFYRLSRMLLPVLDRMCNTHPAPMFPMLKQSPTMRVPVLKRVALDRPRRESRLGLESCLLRSNRAFFNIGPGSVVYTVFTCRSIRYCLPMHDVR